MALALEGANAVWNRVKIALANRNSASHLVLRALKTYLATQAKNPKLQFVFVDGSINASDGGNTADQVLANAACTLYAVYGHKVGATETILKLTNHATTAATNGTQDGAIAATASGDFLQIYPDGRALSAGLTVTEDTTRTGSTLTLAANRIDGFVIIGA